MKNLLPFFILIFAASINAATFTVTRSDDRNAVCVSGVDCSLREAIKAANSTIDDDTINIQVATVSIGFYNEVFQGQLVVNSTSTAGKLTITKSTSVINVTISGQVASRVFYVNEGADLTIHGVTITKGQTYSSYGAGIYNDGGSLTLINSAVSDNDSQYGSGAGIYSIGGTISLLNSTVSRNGTQGLGGGIYNNGGTLTITNSNVSNNDAERGGAGIWNQGGTLTITNSTVSNNLGQFSGGGIHSTGGTLTVNNSTVSNNDGGTGGGILNAGTLLLTNSTVSGNWAYEELRGAGGGIYNGGTATLINSTVSGNSAYSNFRPGGGIFNSGTLNLTSVTVTNNRSTGGYTCAGGIYSFGIANLYNTIVAGPHPFTYCGSPDFNGSVSSTSSYNIIGNNQGMTGITNGTNGNQVGTLSNPIDPRLAPLANNGGPTRTHALLPDSPAIDRGNSFGLTTDQRGLPRPADLLSYPNAVGGDGADIGAFELQPVDRDGDGIADVDDNCPNIDNADQANNDGDAQGDICDMDDDNDGVADTQDAFPFNPNESVDTDGDGTGNNADPDDDNDNQTDVDEIACGTNPLLASSKSLDTDSDNRPNCVDTDDDNDSIADTADNCPLTSNPDQADFDLDGIGDACDPQTGPAKNKEQCKNGGWMRFDFPRPFKNQGDCIQFVNTGK